MKFSRRKFLGDAALGAGVMLCPSRFSLANADAGEKLNFLFILVDDLGWADVGCFGSSFYETPNIDGLAAGGMKFTNAYAACPVCSPTRASIMTGKYPARMDTTDFFGAAQPDVATMSERRKKEFAGRALLPARYEEQLALEEVTIAETLQESGYKTFFAGKWHLGPTEEYWPERQGFDVNKGGWRSGGPYGPGRYFVPYGNPRLEDGPAGEHLPDRLAREAATFIEEHQERPFLAYLSFYSVHTPLIGREDLVAKYREKAKRMGIEEGAWGMERKNKLRMTQNHAVYAAMVEAMDMAVGVVLSKLDALGLAENTAVIFFSDNGGLSTSEGHPTSNLPLRGGKGWLYEGGIREPMIVRWPGRTAAGSVCDAPVISTDFYPTMLEMAGIELKPAQHMDGVSFVPLLGGEAMDRGSIYWHYPHYPNQGSTPGAAIRDGRWKLIKWFENDSLELYDLETDVGEQNNLARRHPLKVRKLHKKLRAWQEEVGAKFPTENTLL